MALCASAVPASRNGGFVCLALATLRASHRCVRRVLRSDSKLSSKAFPGSVPQAATRRWVHVRTRVRE